MASIIRFPRFEYLENTDMDELVKDAGALSTIGSVVFIADAVASDATLPLATTLTESFFAPRAAPALTFTDVAEDRFVPESAVVARNS
jgi:hypothetical protein